MRTATAKDIHRIERVYLRSWRGAYKAVLDADELEELGARRVRDFDWAAGIRAPDAEVLVGFDADGALAGVAQAKEVLDATRNLPEITMLYVDPAAWGTGLATELLAACTDWLASRGHHHARLRVAANHPRARRFYEREGWDRDRDLELVTTELTQLVYYRKALA